MGIETYSWEVRKLREDLRSYDSDRVLKRIESALPGAPDPLKKTRTKSKNWANYRGGIRLLIEWAEGAQEDLIKPSKRFGRLYVVFLMARYGDRRATVATRLSHAHTLFVILQDRGCVDPDKCNPFRTPDFAEVWPVRSSNPESE